VSTSMWMICYLTRILLSICVTVCLVLLQAHDRHSVCYLIVLNFFLSEAFCGEAANRQW
jgi:hypothetical protein